jgi:hypothetical protein
MNQFVNITNETIVYNPYANSVQSLSFQRIVNEICLDWRNYSTYAHIFYIKLIWLYFFFGIMRKFVYNKTFHWILWELEKKEAFYYKLLKFFRLNILEIKVNPFKDLQDISIGIVIVRILQVYYIGQIYLGGIK